MTHAEIIAHWNAQADEHNQWDELGEDEKVEWAARVQELINTGLLPVSLQLQHSNETSLHLQQTGALKKITYPTPAADGAEKEDTFAADALLTTRSLSEVIADLRRTLSE